MKTKKVFLFVAVVLMAFVLFACNEKKNEHVVTITTPENVTVYESQIENFNVLNGVKVVKDGNEISAIFLNVSEPKRVSENGKNYVCYELSISFDGVKYQTNYKVEVIADEVDDNDGYTSIAEAIELCGTINGYETEEEYTIRGTISSIVNATYGAVYITDGTNELYVYGIYAEDGTSYDQMTEKPLVGDIVVLKAKLGYFKDAPEMKRSTLISFEKQKVEADPSLILENIAAVRDEHNGTSVLTEGVVMFVTYKEGMSVDGFILGDETGSIYVYGTSVAAGVKVGNKVKVQGTKLQYVSESEANVASKYGYKGMTQIANALIIENDNKTDNAFPEFSENTISNLLNASFDEDITTLVYKVKTLVHKAPGADFVNYYLNDVDGETGSYTYTKCSGADFAWLDEFDGKYVEMLMCVINAKVTNTGSVYRFLPIKVLGEATFDNSSINDYVYDFVVDKAIETSYPQDSRFDLPTTFENTYFNFNGTIEYTSSDNTILTIENGQCYAAGIGSCVVTVSTTNNGVSETRDYNVTVTAPINGENVIKAIEASDDSEVCIKGIIMSSLVNRDGFYIADETGMIAVTMLDKTELSKLKLGEEVIISGVRSHILKAGASNIGQSVVKDAVVLANNHGSHTYPTNNIITDKSLTDFKSYSVNDDYTTNIYEVEVKVAFEKTAYYSNAFITTVDGSVSIGLYCSSANQYSFLNDFDGQTVKMHIALCNWNSKSYYTACVISVITESGIILNDCNFK